ncbi:precorrin-6Y C5,15-methyltransferase (decarboxylating) subunit CbiT, partial [Desulfobacterales bacterium HSG17]|nr:precorrin-6Y C5,15-methyltransferase (decarboxylating) subunit CbiT [Desulfobacterales bacterium HSG17]
VKAVILTSGDALYYGIGKSLAASFNDSQLRFHPNLSLVAAAAAKIGLSWGDVKVLSLHGRENLSPFLTALAKDYPFFLYTDPRHDPVWVAKQCLKWGLDNLVLTVFVHLGSDSEEIFHGKPSQISEKQFSSPNLVLIQSSGPSESVDYLTSNFGRPDTLFHHDSGMITKAEIRAISLSKLHLQSDSILWDIGAGSGSVSIEAAGFINTGQVIAFEKKTHRVDLIRENQLKFRAFAIEIIPQAFQDANLEDLAPPSRIFIGGGGKDIGAILDIAYRQLAPNGRMVINTVLLESLETVRCFFKTKRINLDIVQVNIQKNMAMPYGSRMQAFNPVFVISLQKETDSL